jgi:uncharacterized protein YegJ (DUF2314 family)
MKREPESNLTYYRGDHAPRPDPALAHIEPLSLIGKHVKKSFVTDAEHQPRVCTEHMWVKVFAVIAEDGQPVLVGELANEPSYISELRVGDEVRMSMSEIEEVHD